MNISRLLASTLTLLIWAHAAAAEAQIAAEGSIRGFIKDEQGAVLPGVSLTATTPQSSTQFTAVSDSQGFYRLLNLPPGVYDVVAALPGFSRFERQGLEVRAEMNIQVDVTLKLGAIEETIQVTGETPMLEVQKTVQAINISGDFQRSLPLSGRRVWQDALDLTPGIMSRSTDQFGGSVYFLRGTENENHVVQVDGVDAGSFRQNWPGQYLGLSSEALADIQIKTAGVDAAAPLAEGMVINIATPSGTNRLKGSAGSVFTARSWNGNNTPGGTPVISQTVQPDLSLGGPIQKDKTWFFGAFRYTDRSTGVSRNAELLANLNALVPGFVPFDNTGQLEFGSLKVNTQLTQKHQFQVTYQRDANREETNFQVNGSNMEINGLGGSTYGARLTSIWGDRMTTKLLVGYGEKFRNLNVEDSGGGELDDVVAGVKYIVDNGLADGKRLGIGGGSHGGTMVAYAITKHPDLFKVALELYGVVDRATYNERTNRNAATRWMMKMGGTPEEKPEVYRKANALADVAKIKTPVYVMHGEDDPQVPPFESAQFVEALKKNGKVYRYQTYPKEGHGFSQRDHRLDAWSRQLEFLKKYLQPAYGQSVTSTTE